MTTSRSGGDFEVSSRRSFRVMILDLELISFGTTCNLITDNYAKDGGPEAVRPSCVSP